MNYEDWKKEYKKIAEFFVLVVIGIVALFGTALLIKLLSLITFYD
jgi:hypothetical protein